MPYYSLETIHEVAKDENKIFLSRLAQRDASNLGYTKKDIAACLKELNN
ncbi:MAG: type II toxin-antitoxin system MqsR family toxin [Pseudomonadota bacterium]